MPVVVGDVDAGECFVGYLDSFLVLVHVEFALDGESGLGAGGRDEGDDDEQVLERAAFPVSADVAEEAVLVSGREELPLPALSEPCMTVSRHTAPVIRSWAGSRVPSA